MPIRKDAIQRPKFTTPTIPGLGLPTSLGEKAVKVRQVGPYNEVSHFVAVYGDRGLPVWRQVDVVDFVDRELVVCCTVKPE